MKSLHRYQPHQHVVAHDITICGGSDDTAQCYDWATIKLEVAAVLHSKTE